MCSGHTAFGFFRDIHRARAAITDLVRFPQVEEVIRENVPGCDLITLKIRFNVVSLSAEPCAAHVRGLRSLYP
jgi:hypothetical protein